MTLQIQIRRHQFNVACSPQDEQAMRAAARAVERQVAQVRSKTKVSDGERAALMAALQIAFQRPHAAPVEPAVSAMAGRIDDALARTDDFLQERAQHGADQ